MDIATIHVELLTNQIFVNLLKALLNWQFWILYGKKHMLEDKIHQTSIKITAKCDCLSKNWPNSHCQYFENY